MRILLSAVRILGAFVLLGGIVAAVPACTVGGPIGAGAALGVAVLGALMMSVKRFA